MGRHGICQSLQIVAAFERRDDASAGRRIGDVADELAEPAVVLGAQAQIAERIGAPERCVHIGDRESDIYELFCLAQELGTHFLVRSCVDRLAESGT